MLCAHSASRHCKSLIDQNVSNYSVLSSWQNESNKPRLELFSVALNPPNSLDVAFIVMSQPNPQYPPEVYTPPEVYIHEEVLIYSIHQGSNMGD